MSDLKQLSFVYRDKSAHTIPLDAIARDQLEALFGPVLAGMMEACISEVYDVAIPEVPSAASGAPLKQFAENGCITYIPLAVTELAPAYKAAERLDIKGLVLYITATPKAATPTSSKTSFNLPLSSWYLDQGLTHASMLNKAASTITVAIKTIK